MIHTYQRLKRRRQINGDASGFTLIELLIVIVVLGILAAVVIFALGGVTGKSAVAACQADGATISTGIAAFNANNTGVTVTQALLTGSTDGGPYIQSWPTNLPHYAYGIDSGKLYVVTNSPSAGGVTATSVTAATTGAVLYSGPDSCSNVQ